MRILRIIFNFVVAAGSFIDLFAVSDSLNASHLSNAILMSMSSLQERFNGNLQCVEFVEILNAKGVRDACVRP